MIDFAEELLEKLQAPLREFSVAIDVGGRALEETTENGVSNLLTNTYEPLWDKSQTVDFRVEQINLVDIPDITLTNSYRVPVTLPAGTYYFSADMSNGGSIRYGYITTEYVDNSVKSYNLSNTYRRAHVITATKDIKAIYFGGNNNIPFYYKNIQISKHNISRYHPYESIEDFRELRTYAMGKNLFSFQQVEINEKEFCINMNDLPVGDYYFLADVSSTDTDSETCLIDIEYGDQDYDSYQIERGKQVGFSFTARKPFGAITLCASDSYGNAQGDTATFNNIFIGYSSGGLQYTPWVTPQPIQLDQNGYGSFDTREGENNAFTIVIFHPNVCIVDCNYTYINEYTYYDNITNHDDLIDFKVERMGSSNKYFGYGIGHKLTMELRNPKDKDYEWDKNKFCNITMDDWDYVFPSFYVDEIQRDEKTGNLTITAYDKIHELSKHTFTELKVQAPYTLNELIMEAQRVIKMPQDLYTIPSDDEELSEAMAIYVYENGGNFEGTETLREVLDAIAEVTQTIYFLDFWNSLCFKRLSYDDAVLTIPKAQYFDLETGHSRILTSIASVTELGDNLQPPELDRNPINANVLGEPVHDTQYIRNNPLLDTQPNREELLEHYLDIVGGLTITPFRLNWRGNYLLELGDKINIETKTGDVFTTYLLNDTIYYNGGWRQESFWEYDAEDAVHTNPTTLGEAIKQTYAKVDKANKQIDLVVSEVGATNENVSQLSMDTSRILATVNSMEETTTDALGSINEELANINNKVSMAMSAEDVEILVSEKISNGVASVETSTGFVFNQDGLTISKHDEDIQISTQITNNGMGIYDGNIADSNRVLTANNQGVYAKNLQAYEYLMIGKNSRFEDYGSNRTACFWIGG